MVQVIPQTPGFGEQLGKKLSSGLDFLMQSKVAGMQKEKQLELASQLKREEQKAKMDQLMQLLGGVTPPPLEGEDTIDIDVGEDAFGRPASSNISDQQILAASFVDPNAARLLQAQKDNAEKRQEKKEERSYKRNEKYLHGLDEAVANMGKTKLALQQMKMALDQGDFESWRNIIGDFTGIEKLKSSSAQVVNSAAKEFLVGTLSEVKGRPNQFLEQQISKALLNPQYTKGANKLIWEGLNFAAQIKEKEKNIADELEAKYVNRGEEIPRNFQQQVRAKLKKEYETFEKNYEKQWKDLLSSKPASPPNEELLEGEILMIDPQGNIRAVKKEDVKKAKKAKYKLYQ